MLFDSFHRPNNTPGWCIAKGILATFEVADKKVTLLLIIIILDKIVDKKFLKKGLNENIS